MGQTRKTLPKNTSIDTIAIVRDKKTKTRRFKIKIGEFDDAGKIYNKSHGIVARKEDDKPFYENVKDFFNNLPTRATNVHDRLNYADPKNDFDKSVYTQIIASPEEEDLNIVFDKFRKFLNDNKDEIAKYLSDNVSDAKITKEFMTEGTSNSHVYLIHETSGTPSEPSDDLIQKLEEYFELILKIITETPSKVGLTQSLRYDNTEIIIDYDPYNWSGKEVQILQEPNNNETALYVIGQVFNIIDPDFNDNFLQDNSPNTNNGIHLPMNSSTFFKLIVEIPTVSRIDYDQGYYVGDVDGKNKRRGSGIMVWKNGNMFEGKFRNNMPASGHYTESGKETESLTIVSMSSTEPVDEIYKFFYDVDTGRPKISLNFKDGKIESVTTSL